MKFLHCAFAIRIAMVKRGFPHWNSHLTTNDDRHETGRIMIRVSSFIRQREERLRTDFTDQLGTRLGRLRKAPKKFLVSDPSGHVVREEYRLGSGNGQRRSRFLAPNFSIGIA